MEIETTLNFQVAEERLAKLKAMSDAEILQLTPREAVPFWYAVAYMNPGMHTDDAGTWGEFRTIAQRIIELSGDFVITDDQLYPYEATKAGVLLETKVITDEVCDHCQEYYLITGEGTQAFDAEGKQICICEDCKQGDFAECWNPRCGVVHVAGLTACPVCQEPKVTRKYSERNGE